MQSVLKIQDLGISPNSPSPANDELMGLTGGNKVRQDMRKC